MLRKFGILFTIQMLFVSFSYAQCVSGNCYDGKGTFIFENGDKYNGLWKKGNPNGYGTYEFASGSTYKGNFKNGLMSGRGTYTYGNGDKYIGDWKEGKMNGRGHFHWELAGDLMTNAKYEGTFKDGVPTNIEFKPNEMPVQSSKKKK